MSSMSTIVASNRSGAIPLPSINSRSTADCHPDSEIKLINSLISEVVSRCAAHPDSEIELIDRLISLIVSRCVGEVIGMLGKATRRFTSDPEID